MQEKLELFQRRLIRLFWKVAEEKEEIAVDGVKGYNSEAQFTNGKVINLCSYVALNLLTETGEKEKGFQALRQVIHFTARMKMETWGILNAIEGIYRLYRAGRLAAAVDEETRSLLRKSLNWRSFVDENTLELIHKPTNYYGVAFGIARYRELLGWEPVKYSELLLNRLMDHISRYSGEEGFMDETPGFGRFDRYSILIPAEITALVLDTLWQEPELMRTMLNRSAHIVLQLANKAGTGFSYGRSIGAYGESAVLQILSTAMALGGIFTPEEEQIAYGYCCRVLARMIDFWYDEEMRSVNMWEKGRKTDGYRNKNRILGENISLSMQMIGAMEQWKARGYGWKGEPENWEQLLHTLPPYSVTFFTKKPLPRCLIIVRDGDTVWQLPIVHGGEEYADRDPYLPVPRANFVLEAVPDASHCAWVPRFEMKDGAVLVPAGYIEAVTVAPIEGGCRVKLRQTGLLPVGKRPVGAVRGACIETTYSFQKGGIQREDAVSMDEAFCQRVSRVRLICEIMKGKLTAFGYDGKTQKTYEQANENNVCLDTPHGPCTQIVEFVKAVCPEDRSMRMAWRLRA